MSLSLWDELPDEIQLHVMQFVPPHPLACVFKEGYDWIANEREVNNKKLLTFLELDRIYWDDYYYTRSRVKGVINKRSIQLLKKFHLLNMTWRTRNDVPPYSDAQKIGIPIAEALKARLV